MNVTVIRLTDLGDPRVSRYRDLKNPKGERPTFIAETNGVIASCLDLGLRPVSALCADRLIEGRDKELIARFGEAPVYTAKEETLSALTGYPLTRGILAEFERPEPLPETDEALFGGRTRIAILENVRDASNIGSVFRSAAALGTEAVLLGSGCCDPLHRKAVRTSMGGVFRVPWYKGNLSAAQLISRAKAAGFTVLALALKEDALPIEEALRRHNGKTALVLGSEDAGLTQEAVALSDAAVIIPMHSGMDSLNVSVAAAIAFYASNRT